MDLASTFHEVVRIAQTALDATSGWHSLIGYLERQCGDPLPQLRIVDIQQDVDGIRRQIVELLEGDPPPDDLNAIYFGLFDVAGEKGAEGIGYHIAGVRGFDPENIDSLCDPAWRPEKRFRSSAALEGVKQAELAFAASGQADRRALLGYAGQLGAALVVFRFASAGLLPGLRCVVGFDSGDFAEIAA